MRDFHEHRNERPKISTAVPIGNFLLVFFLIAVSCQSAAAQIANYETEGNLASTHKLNCISLSEAKNGYSPPDLMNAFSKCLEDGRYSDAVQLFMLAGTYARFDTLRVADTTSHDAFQVLVMSHQPNDSQMAQFRAAAKNYTVRDSAESSALCVAVKQVGPPNYSPDYMAKHGMGAFFGTGGHQSPDFDTKAAWKKSLDSYLHCDISNMQ